ncbi:PDZ domain-containing protein [bacterium]|nr:PDZ domain-containing protein [bacterium]
MKIFKRTSIFAAILLAAFICAVLGLSIALPAKATDDNSVFLGGMPIGIVSKGEGLVISELVNVTTKNGNFSPALKAGLSKGDIIIAVDGKEMYDMIELNETIAKSEKALIFTIKRGNEKLDITVEPVFDIVQNALKVGLMVKNDLAGIGTLTYITHSYTFGALGHMITDEFGHGEIYQKGKIYNCELTGYIKGKEGKAGELQGKMVLREGSVGVINKNNFCGLFGKYDSNKLPNLTQISIGTRLDVKSGSAYIYTSIDSNGPQMYEIEIIKAQNQASPAEKSMVIRVTDGRLKEKTGGILQGMSGSPIIQNNKLIGAITHVFISDPTKGYGIYIDWMLEN